MAQTPGHLAIALTLAALVASAGRLSVSVSADVVPAGRSNIVVLMADDLDLVSFEAAWGAGLLPHFQGVFGTGTRFREAFVTESLCCPARATYLTGLYPHNHGVIRTIQPHGGYQGFMRSFADNNLAVWMQGVGYRTTYIGKYLNGYTDARVVPPGWDDWRGLIEPILYCMYGYALGHDGRLAFYGNREQDYQTDVLASLAEEVILARHAEADTRPLFLNIGPTAPHSERGCYDGIRPAPRHAATPPLSLPRTPSFNEADVSDKPAWMRELPLVDETRMERLYNERIAAMRAVDDLLGRVVAALERTDELERTAFLFTSDNGFLLGQHRWEGKILLYEESIRVPLLLRLPASEGPSNVDAVTLNNDLAPTILELAGALPGLVMDGRSLLPLLDGTATRWRKRFLAAFPPLTDGFTPAPPPFVAVRSVSDGDLSGLVYAETFRSRGTRVAARELYDLSRDPHQIASRHRDPAYHLKQRRLKQHLRALAACGGGTCQPLEEE